ncbi:transmembrane protein 214 isoform X1 [Drosophila tropicalis]|uniref:transmembrane protein 214 isoform X1 n=1 Tax=Drosophila tropicalis TaxID=46794 RepID=UPI0035ABA8A4
MPSASNQWEVVQKSRKQKNLEKKVSAHTEQKRIAAQVPKLEELLPSQQYRDLFGNNNNYNNIKSQSPAKSSSGVSHSSLGKKNATKSSATVGGGNGNGNNNSNGGSESGKKQTQKQQSAKPKTLEQALLHITPDDFLAQLEQVKLSCPGSEIRWLSHITLYLNGALAYDCDPTFSGRSFKYPTNLASVPLKQTILEFIQSMSETNLEYFFYSLLDTMATDLNNNQTVVGYKFMLQLIGQSYPSICSVNMAKTALLRNSYQNRSNICLSILWAIGQGGYTSLNEGVKIWQNLMLPNLKMRNYTKYVVDYMEKILDASTRRKTENTLYLNQQEFFHTYNALNANYPSISNELMKSLKRSAGQLLQRYIASGVKHANIFLTLLREIIPSNNSHKYSNEIEGCISCLLSSGGDDCLKIWRMNCKKQLFPTLLLLKAIDESWSKSTNPLAKLPAFQTFLQDLLNENVQLAQMQQVLLSVQEKSSAQQKKNKQNTAAQKKKCGCCKWVFGSIFLLALIAGSLCYDTQVNGKGVFEKSATGKILKNAGVLPHVEKGWYVTMSALAKGYKWGEEHVPPYAKPAIKVTCDVWKLARNAACTSYESGKTYFNAKWPEVAKFVDQYVPNLSNKLEAFAAGARDLAINGYEKSASLIKEKVLVGRFSPENLNQAFNQTRNIALDYYNQLHKKIDAYAKLK